MDQTEKNRNTASNMRFLLCFKPQQTANQCCCGRTLRVGTQIICILNILATTIFIFILSKIYNEFYFVYILEVIISICQLIGLILTLISTFNNNFSFAYYGHSTYIILNLLTFIISIALLLILAFYHDYFAMYFYIFYSITTLVPYFLIFFFSFTIYSFIKELGLGNMTKLDGAQHSLIVASEAQDGELTNVRSNDHKLSSF